jgi:hypothetical protein
MFEVTIQRVAADSLVFDGKLPKLVAEIHVSKI